MDSERPAISGFFGDYRFLSNFWPAEVELDDVIYPTVEHAYQAAKFLDPEVREAIRILPSPGQAKRAGRKYQIRDDWSDVKFPIMRYLVFQKFAHPELEAMLLATGSALLVEENTWGDVYWGQCKGVGSNHLGNILMYARDYRRIAVE